MEAYLKNILKTIFCSAVKGSSSSSKALAEELGVTSRYVDDLCGKLADKGLVLKKGAAWGLTELGRRRITVVLAGGVFDIIHLGHLFTLSSAKKLGDVLIVSIARDKTVRKMKGRDPLNGEEKRLILVNSLRQVDAAVLGSETDMFEVVERVKPDVIALGYDQKHNAEELMREAERRGIQVKVVRFDSPMPGIKSSSIIKNSEAVEEFSYSSQGKERGEE